MQFSGSLSQSTLHLKRSQEFQPIGGVRPSPLSRAYKTETPARSSNTFSILMTAKNQTWTTNKQEAENLLVT